MTGIEAMKLEQQIHNDRGGWPTYCVVRQFLLHGTAEEYPYLIHALQAARPGDYVLGCLSSKDAQDGNGEVLWYWKVGV